MNSFNIVFISNNLNHHQVGFCDYLHKLAHGNFFFIATAEISNERLNLGYKEFCEKVYYISFANKKDECLNLINNCDFLIAGDCADFLLRKRRKEQKPIFKYSEHHFKKKLIPPLNLLRKLKFFIKNSKNLINNNEYLLCSSSFVADEYNKLGFYKNKTLKFGYFPINAYKNKFSLISADDAFKFLWIGRFLGWKRPMLALKSFYDYIKNNNYNGELTFVGAGDKKILNKLQKFVRQKNIFQNVHFVPAVSYDKISKFYSSHNIFLFTSDKNEGWGAVLNEAMSHGLLVFASELAGSTKFLNLNNSLLTFTNRKTLSSLLIKTLTINNYPLINSKQQLNIETIDYDWNYEKAAIKFYEICLHYTKEQKFVFPKEGVLSNV